jgi:DNA-directed RNA polymerase specialized sigma24 family protein
VSTRPATRAQRAEQLVAEVSREKWDTLLRVFRTRLPREDLEDLLSQATLELVVQARRGTLPDDRALVAGALSHKFDSRIKDRHRAINGRSLARTTERAATSIDDERSAAHDRLASGADTERAVAARERLREINRLLPRLTPNQRLVIANDTYRELSVAGFCQLHGWKPDRYRKTSQRGRERLEQLLDEAQRQAPAPAAARDAPAARASARESAPARAPRPPAPPSVLPAPAPASASRDPLAAHRPIIGERHADAIARRAGELRPQLAASPHADLLAVRDQAASASWQRLDRPGALESRRLSRDLGFADAELASTTSAIAAIDEQSSGLDRSLAGRRARRSLAGELAARQAELPVDRSRVDRLHERVAELRARGADLDRWAERHGDDAALWLAAEHELADRRSLAAAEPAARAIEDPPRHVLDRIGDPPEVSAAHRGEWEALAERLEHDRLVDDAALVDASPVDRDPDAERDLERRVRALPASQRQLELGELGAGLEF